jgi:hypothetical protein
MAKNFNDGPIPVEHIHQAILTVLNPEYQNIKFDYDPSGGNYLGYVNGKRPKEYFDYISWNDLYLWTTFQRDVSPNHIEKIYKDFDESSVIVPCIIKITLNTNKTVYCIWDGHHTIQVCRLKGFKKFQSWIIDLDQFTKDEIESAGFGKGDEERIKFGCYVAGNNMRRINGLNKRPLAPYDDFMIGLETRDSKFVAMNNILKHHGCMPKRNTLSDGAWTQIKCGIECYDLPMSNGQPSYGRFWSRAIAFQRGHWKQGHLVMEIYRPMSYLYQRAEIEGIIIPQSFDQELAKMLSDRWGGADEVQLGIKESYQSALQSQKIHVGPTGTLPQDNTDIVLDGIINFYRQTGGKTILPGPGCQWRV